MVRAVRSIHKIGIVHGDLKPENFIVTTAACVDLRQMHCNPRNVANGVPCTNSQKWIDNYCAVKIADYGLACLQGKTCTGAAQGTPLFMAPELYDPTKVTTTSVDMWALGNILYMILFGKPLMGYTDWYGRFFFDQQAAIHAHQPCDWGEFHQMHLVREVCENTIYQNGFFLTRTSAHQLYKYQYIRVANAHGIADRVWEHERNSPGHGGPAELAQFGLRTMVH
eukprot:TRINITY_DN9844_c0_g1_i2.p1 TRINITY_DN9844_c0_g1~~TRINITY_DN9844_c0_g1_i2.p1  ORF type:complete len:224 (-),score=8.79 TRINITY_DN9844_c0_g1_i2:205-876(-)